MSTDLLTTTRLASFPREIGSHIGKCLSGVASMEAFDEAHAAGVPGVIEDRLQAGNRAKTHRLRVEDRHRQGEASDQEVDVAIAAEKAVATDTAQIMPGQNALIAQADASRIVNRNCLQTFNGLKWSAAKNSALVHQQTTGDAKRFRPSPWEPEDPVPNIQLVPILLPDGADLNAMVADQQRKVASLHAGMEDVNHAPGRKETAERRLPGLVADLAARGAPKLIGAGEPGFGPKISADKYDIGAEPARNGGGNTPRIVDPLAVAAWLDPDKVLAKLRADLEEAYLGVDLQLDPHEKQRRKRELKAEILKAERVECAAIWALVEAGDPKIRFRPNCDPRAILGIN